MLCVKLPIPSRAPIEIFTPEAFDAVPISARYSWHFVTLRDTSWHVSPVLHALPNLWRSIQIFTPEFISAILHGRICARILLIMTCFLIETVLRRGSGVIRSAIMHSRSNFAAIGSEHNMVLTIDWTRLVLTIQPTFGAHSATGRSCEKLDGKCEQVYDAPIIPHFN